MIKINFNALIIIIQPNKMTVIQIILIGKFASIQRNLVDSTLIHQLVNSSIMIMNFVQN